jgi:hypothetical protein
VSVGLAIFSLQAPAAVESVALDYVALDNSVDCHRTFFRSSQHFKGTIFAVPRVLQGNGVYAATGLESTRIFNILPSKNPGFYDLTVYLYFPANDESARGSKASLFKKDNEACNWDEAIAAINKNIADPKDWVKVASNIPLTAIEMKIPGFARAGRVGTFSSIEEPSILEYYGKSISVHFEITELERQLFESQVVSYGGIDASIKMYFRARSRTGSVNAKIDTEGLVSNFSAEAKAKGMKYVGEANLAALLTSAVQKTSIEIHGEEGSSSESLGKVTLQIIEKVFKEVSLLPVDTAAKKTASAKDPSSVVDVSAVMDILKKRLSGTISFEMFSASEVASAQREVNLQTERLKDPNLNEVTVKAQYLDPSSGVSLNAGETITIVPAYWYIEKFEYREKKVYLSETDLKDLRLDEHFSDLTDERMHIANRTINNNSVAIGSWYPLLFGDKVQLPYRFRWLRVLREASNSRISSNEIPTTYEALKELPVFLSFSKLGDRKFTRLSNLMGDNEFWNAVYDTQTGRIILTAKIDLGTIRFRERIRGKENIEVGSTPVILDEVFEIMHSPFGRKSTRDYHMIKSDAKPMIKQKAIVFNVSRPMKLAGKELEYVKALRKANSTPLIEESSPE